MYQLCVDHISRHGSNPYVFSQSFDLNKKYGLLELSQLVYADDHTLVNNTAEGVQRTLDKIYVWLKWTQCMKAKPSKCKSLAFGYTPVPHRQYGSVSACLHIGDSAIADISDAPFKFLGRLIYKDTSKSALKQKLLVDFMGPFNELIVNI